MQLIRTLKAPLYRLWTGANQRTMRLLISVRFSRRQSRQSPRAVSHSTVVPYGTLDCEALFAAIAAILGSGKPGPLVKTRSGASLGQQVGRSKHTGHYSWSEKVRILGELFTTPDLWRGAINQYKRNCHPDEFFDKSCFDVNLLDQIKRDYLAGKAIAEGSRLVVITDLAYTRSRSIVEHARISGADVLMINPFGHCEKLNLQVPFAHSSISPGLSLTEMKGLIAQRTGQQSTFNQILDDRLKGYSLDWNIRESQFETRNLQSEHVNPAVTVFLHAIRDAQGYDPTTCSEECEDSVSWSRKIIECMSDSGVNFRIRRHPSETWYPQEKQIVDRLFKEGGIRQEQICSRPTLSAIESSKCIITLAGTVTLEAIAQRRCAITFASFYPSGVGLRSEFGQLADLVADQKHRTPGIEAVQWAQHALVLRELPRLKQVRPRQPMIPTLSALERVTRDFASGWAMTLRLLSPSGAKVLSDELHKVLLAT